MRNTGSARPTYTRNRFMEAATAFAEGYKRYPKRRKAPDSLLKLGMSLARANQKQNACVALAQLDHDFPQAGAAVKERAAAEKNAGSGGADPRERHGLQNDPASFETALRASRMRIIGRGIKENSHPEEPAQRASRRTHCARGSDRPVVVAPLTLDELAAALAAIGGFEAGRRSRSRCPAGRTAWR